MISEKAGYQGEGTRVVQFIYFQVSDEVIFGDQKCFVGGSWLSRSCEIEKTNMGVILGVIFDNFFGAIVRPSIDYYMLDLTICLICSKLHALQAFQNMRLGVLRRGEY